MVISVCVAGLIARRRCIATTIAHGINNLSARADGGPGQSPTADLRVRSALLYATELPGHQG